MASPIQLLAALALLSLALYHFILYPLVFHPLARVPGPKIAALTRYYILYKAWREQRNHLIHDLHSKYGPIVRLGPNEISIADHGYIKDIYVGNFDKAQFYGQFGLFGQINTFASLTKDAHAKRRKIMSKSYSKSAVSSPENESMVKEKVALTTGLLDKAAGRGASLDVYDIFQAMAMDVVTRYSYGETSASHMLEDEQQRKLIDSFRIQTAMWFFTTWMPGLRSFARDAETAENSAKAQQFVRDSYYSSGFEKDSIVQILKSAGIQGDNAASEMGDHIAAGHQTTGITMAYLTWVLSTRPEIQQKLRAELHKAFGTPQQGDFSTPPYKEVDTLPYLDSVLNETLRVYAAIPGSEPRIVPPKGLMWRGSKSVPPFLIPGGTLISMQPHTLHRNPEVFPDPDSFDPERWLKASPDQLKLMHKHMMPFGAGVRMCLGIHLATEEMKLLTTAIYSRFKSEIVEGIDYEKEMVPVDKYTTHPAGNRTVLKFVRV